MGDVSKGQHCREWSSHELATVPTARSMRETEEFGGLLYMDNTLDPTPAPTILSTSRFFPARAIDTSGDHTRVGLCGSCRFSRRFPRRFRTWLGSISVRRRCCCLQHRVPTTSMPSLERDSRENDTV